MSNTKEDFDGWWLDQVWIEERKKRGFENSLLSLDAFVAHLTDGVKAQLLESNLNIRPIPAGCTSKCQPMDASLNKPFKNVLRRCWVKYFAGAVEGFPNAHSDTSFELTVTTRQHMIE